MSGIGRRLRKEEDGYALVISVILLFVMMMLLVVGLQAGNSALDQSQRGIEWTRTLTVAESGINDAMSRLSGDRAAVSPCPTSGSTACTGEGGEYQVDWADSGESVVITSTGYYPASTPPRSPERCGLRSSRHRRSATPCSPRTSWRSRTTPS